MKRASLYLIVLRGVTLVSGALTNVIVARTLGAEGKGIILLAMLLPQMVASLGGLGLRASVIYFAGKGFAQRDLVGKALLLGLGLSAVYAVAGWILHDILSATILKGLELRWVVLALALIPVYMLWSYGDGLLQGMFRFGSYAVAHLTSHLLKLMLLVVLLFGFNEGLRGGMIAYTVAAVVPAVMILIWAWKSATSPGPRVTLGQFMGYGLQVHWGNLAQRANLSIDVFLINPIVGTTAVGLYSVAVMLAELVWQIPGAVSQVLFPRVAGSSKEDAAHTSALVSRFAFSAALLPAIVLALTAPWVLKIFGAEFAGAKTALWALLPGVVGLSVGMMLSQYLAGTGRPVLNSIASAISFVFNLTALFLLVPRIGIVGAGIASSIGYLLQAGIVAAYFARETGLSWTDFLVLRPSDIDRVRASWRARRAPAEGA